MECYAMERAPQFHRTHPSTLGAFYEREGGAPKDELPEHHENAALSALHYG